jgi:cytochrome c peroxidase
MRSVPAAPRLPKLVSATTLALMLALLLALFDTTRQHRDGSAESRLLVASRSDGDSIAGWRTRDPTPARIVFERQLDALAGALDSLAIALGRPSRRSALRSFRASRLAYKRSESLLELYSPTTAHALNGPLESDDGDAPPRPLGSPAGFQRILSSLGHGRGTDASAGDAAPASRAASQALAISMRDEVRHLRGQTRYLDVGELAMLESARTEIARVTTLGLAGLDLDDPSDAVREAAASFDGMREVVEAEAGARAKARTSGRGDGIGARPDTLVLLDAWMRIARTLRNASAYLLAHPDFERFDRLALITRFANPAALAIARARAPLLAHASPLRRVWRAEAATVFDRHALDATAFAPDYAPAATPALIALGARLFSDTRLSGAQDRSCATCHDPRRAFTDGRARPLLIGAGPTPARNTPTLLDVGYQPLYFADERALSLEDQVGIVLASPTEMGSSADIAAAHVERDPALRAELARALAGRRDDAPTGRNVRIALAAYLRSLDSFDSRFDRAVRGDSLALSAGERAGFTLFMGKARCGTCHFAPLFSGVMPPEFTRSEPEIIGALAHAGSRHAQVDPDLGRAGVDHVAEHRFAFKVPTLRNVALTAPYMHNGAYATLEDVMTFYEHGGGAGVGARLSNPTLSTARLHLTSAERREIVAFLRSLSDTAAPVVPLGAPLQPKARLAR